MASRKRRDDHHKLVVALKHELRRKILRRMSDGRKVSPCELAEELGEKLSNVAYHVRVLAESGALKPVGSKQVRGARKHFYRWSLKPKWAREMLDESDDPPKRPKGKRGKRDN